MPVRRGIFRRVRPQSCDGRFAQSLLSGYGIRPCIVLMLLLRCGNYQESSKYNNL